MLALCSFVIMGLKHSVILYSVTLAFWTSGNVTPYPFGIMVLWHFVKWLIWHFGTLVHLCLFIQHSSTLFFCYIGRLAIWHPGTLSLSVYGSFFLWDRDVLQPSFADTSKFLASKIIQFLPWCVGTLVCPCQTRKESKKKKKKKKTEIFKNFFFCMI